MGRNPTLRKGVGLGLAVLWAVASFALSPAPAAASPPLAYSNAAVLKLEAQCTNEALRTLAECPSPSEREAIRSRKLSWVGWGQLILSGPAIGTVTCPMTASGSVRNEHENGREAEPQRAYGLVEGWGAPQCQAPELTERYESVARGRDTGQPLTVFATAERPLIDETTEASICDEAERAKVPPVNELLECRNASERETVVLPKRIRRRAASLPWNAEAVRGTTRSGETVPRLRVGIATLGECGPGVAEGGEAGSACNPIAFEPSELPSRCYPGSAGYLAVPQGCVVVNVVIPQIPLEIPFYGSLELSVANGVKNGLSPSTALAEEASSGTLVSLSGGHASAVGRLSGLGSGGAELLTLR